MCTSTISVRWRYGLSSWLAEMLEQSHNDAMELPTQWQSGSARGVALITENEIEVKCTNTNSFKY